MAAARAAHDLRDRGRRGITSMADRASRRSIIRTIAGLVFVLATMPCGTLPVGVLRAATAQEATPAAGLGAPDPAECSVEPRPLAFFDRYFGAPTAAQAPAMM